MTDKLAIAVVASFLLLPVAIYIAGKLSRRVSSVSYKLAGAACLAAAFGFFAFGGWYFLDTGQLVWPGGRYVPSTIIYPTDSLVTRVFVGALNAAIGSLLAFAGISMLRLKLAPARPDEA